MILGVIADKKCPPLSMGGQGTGSCGSDTGSEDPQEHDWN